MNATQAVQQPERIADWPRITATLHGPGQRIVHGFAVQLGSLTINGTERACEAESVDALRTGMIARCVAIAIRLRRPVRLTVSDGPQTMNLAVRPEGIVQLVSDAGMIPPAQGLSVHEGRCRVCRRLQPVTEAVCVQCGTPEPHRVEVEPLDVHAVVPDAFEAVAPEAPVTDTIRTNDDVERTNFVRRPRPRPTLRLSFDAQRSVELDENAAIGRNPSPVDGRRPVPVQSPQLMVSRTHALIDVDDAGRIIVTDYNSGNGIETQTDPPMKLDPGTPYVIEPGTTLIMGDVDCTVTFA